MPNLFNGTKIGAESKKLLRRTQVTLFETERLNVDEVTPEEIDEVIEIESYKENCDYLWIGAPAELFG